MTRKTTMMPCGLVFIVLLGSGCQSSGDQAKKELVTELARRQEHSQRSLEFYDQAMKAYQQSQKENALNMLNNAIEIDERNAFAWMALGVIQYEQDNLFEAAHAFYQAGRLTPSRYEPQLNLGTVLESSGRYEKAIQTYEHALTLAPRQLEVMENLARCYIRVQREPDRTLELIQAALGREHRPEWRTWLESEADKIRCK